MPEEKARRCGALLIVVIAQLGVLIEVLSAIVQSAASHTILDLFLVLEQLEKKVVWNVHVLYNLITPWSFIHSKYVINL